MQASNGFSNDVDASSIAAAPLVTFVMPCYNSADYMKRGIESLLEVEPRCEILLVNDGSEDDTSRIAHEYESRYDNIIAIDQENANWGGAVNNGLARARGVFFKVIDSDDYFDSSALRTVIDTLERAIAQGEIPDLLITNYAYDHVPTKSQRIMQYRSFFPKNRLFCWADMVKPKLDKFIMIHAAWYRTALLREAGTHLPTGVSYMDSLLLLHPMPSVEKLYYLDIEPYHYIIGREGQSVEISVVKKHIDQQLMATKLAIDDIDYAQLFAREPHCAMLMVGYISCMMSVSTLHLFMIGTPDAFRKNDELWSYLQDSNPVLYGHIKRSLAGHANRKTKLGRLLARGGYTIAKKVYKFA